MPDSHATHISETRRAFLRRTDDQCDDGFCISWAIALASRCPDASNVSAFNCGIDAHCPASSLLVLSLLLKKKRNNGHAERLDCLKLVGGAATTRDSAIWTGLPAENGYCPMWICTLNRRTAKKMLCSHGQALISSTMCTRCKNHTATKSKEQARTRGAAEKRHYLICKVHCFTSAGCGLMGKELGAY